MADAGAGRVPATVLAAYLPLVDILVDAFAFFPYTGDMLTAHDILSQLPAAGLFRSGGLPWRLSPEPLALPRALGKQLQGLGHILACFQDASHALYRRSAAGEESPWVARLLEAGKPEWLVRVQRSAALAQAAPRILRPDLLWCADGFAMAELDSVPGGLGITLFLSRVYAAAGYAVMGGAEGMAEGFRRAHPEGAVISVSQESADYRPEMEYLAQELGAGFSCTDAESLSPDLSLEMGETLYRFFELFDTDSIPAAQELIQRSAEDGLSLSPPAVQHLEEKIWLALLHAPGLQPYWRKSLRGSHLQRLQQIIPHGWVVDPAPLPPLAALPWLNLHSWQEVAALSQKERRLVLKVSGFSPLAWGSRGVFIGHDMGGKEWAAALQMALDAFPRQPWLLQRFREACIVEHPYYEGDGSITRLRGRVRLCPYYFRTPEGRTELGGCLATITPADKKKIHGMADAILVPCILR